MIWDTKDQNWKKALAELQTYYSEHGNLDIKARYETSDGFKLGRWISNLRAKVKTKGLDQTLTEEQQKQLAALGMIWDRNTEKWEEYFKAAEEYYQIAWKPWKVNDENISQRMESLLEDGFLISAVRRPVKIHNGLHCQRSRWNVSKR